MNVLKRGTEMSLNKSVDQMRKSISELGGWCDSRFHEKHQEYAVVVAFPKDQKIFWGFDKDEQKAYAEAFTQLSRHVKS